ncbi:MAG: sensor histidine kinase [Bdellovibrionales bacterium]
MFKFKIFNFFKKPLFIVAIASMVFSFSLYSYFESINIEEAKSDIESYVSLWKYKLGEDLHYDRNEEFLLTIAEQLKKKPITQYEISKNNQTLYSWKKEGAVDCEHQTSNLLTLKGIHVGKLKTCINTAAITEDTLFSKELILVYVFTTALLFLVGFFPLIGYKKSLFKLADTLENWSGDTSEGFDFYTQDEGTDRILKMIQAGTQSRIDFVDLQSDLEKEKSISKATRRMAHDIRSPMESLESVQLELEGSGSQVLKSIFKSSMKRIRSIVDEAQNDHSDYVVEEAKTNDLKPVIDSILKEKKASFSKTKLKSNIDYNTMAIFVPKKLSRILSNIINNAAESYDDGNGLVEIEMYSDDKFTTILVKDQGKGIDDKHLPLIFQENFSYGKKKGHGIGLSTAKHWLESWGGFIHIESKPSKGTTAKIVIRNTTDLKPQFSREANA